MGVAGAQKLLFVSSMNDSGTRSQCKVNNKANNFNWKTLYVKHWLLHLALSCITFTVGQFITFSVKMYYFYGWVDYYI